MHRHIIAPLFGLFLFVNGLPALSAPPSGMVLIPAGPFEMGDALGEGTPAELPVHTVTLNAFYLDDTEVTLARWKKVADWAAANGYDISNANAKNKEDESHPVHNVTWFTAVKWCNARSEMEGLKPVYYTDPEHTTVFRTGLANLSNQQVDWNANGYRLPTEAEWEKAARGGAKGKRFPWADTDVINHSRANYISRTNDTFDTSEIRGHHPGVKLSPPPGSSPAYFFKPNGYGLYDMAGNMWEWCWDRYLSEYYASSPSDNPRGPDQGSGRALRGGSWDRAGYFCRVSARNNATADNTYNRIGFRTARNAE